MPIRLRFAHVMLGIAAIGLFTRLSASDGCPEPTSFCLNDANVTQRFQFNDGNDGDVVIWRFVDCQTGFEVCGIGTIIKKDNCKVRMVASDDSQNIDAEVNVCLGQGKAKGKGTRFITIGGGFQLTDADLANCPACP